MTADVTSGLVDALRKAGLDDVDTAARRRAEYSSDASNYRLVPSAVAFPRHPDEIVAALAVCRDLGVPLVMRGAGTSIAGNAIGTGLVLDTSRHLNRVLSLDPETKTAVVEPGTVLDTLTRAASAHGLRFGPDPSTHSRCTVGGAIGNNACGNRALRYGRTADNVVALDAVTGTGTRFAAELGAAADAGPEAARLIEALRDLTGRNLATIRTEFGRFRRQVSGYSLEHLLPENGLDIAKFLVGSEGTLALTLGATVNLVRAPKATALAVLGYPDIAAAADAVTGLLPHEPVAMEGFGSRLVDVIRTLRGPAAVPDLPKGESWLFIETGGDTLAEAAGAARRLAADGGCTGSSVFTGAEAAALWKIREDGAGLGGRATADPAWPGWEDSAVPPAKLGPYLRELETLMKSHGVDGIMYGHFGDGCIHVRMDFPLSDRPRVLREFTTEAARLAASYGGTASGEHGDGRARSELLPLQYSGAAISLFGEVKRIFDPENVLNPGVLVDPAPLDSHLRVPSARPLTAGLGFSYPGDRGDLTLAVHRCTGVGKCRADSTGSGGVMCPSYQATKDEKDSTRARARVLQELANGTLVDGWDSPALAESLDLCLSCKGCASDCPTGIDMATYKAEVSYQRYKGRLRPASHYALGWLPRWAALASRAPRLANLGLRLGPLAALGKRLGGIDRRRDLPAFARTPFRTWFAARAAPEPAGKPVLLWVDTFTNSFSPEVGQAAVRVLEAAGYSVRVTSSQVCCGLTWISTGQLDGARRQLERTLRALAPALDAGIPVVGLEPSCTAALRDDAARLLPASDSRVAALHDRVKTLAELLSGTEGWTPPDLSDVTGVAQPHCHQHAVLGWDADAALLKAGGADVRAVGGCCGLAGNFGVEEGHYEVSVAVAENTLLPAVRAALSERGPGATVLADGFSCRTQLDQLASVHGEHLAEVLASRLR